MESGNNGEFRENLTQEEVMELTLKEHKTPEDQLRELLTTVAWDAYLSGIALVMEKLRSGTLPHDEHGPFININLSDRTPIDKIINENFPAYSRQPEGLLEEQSS